MRTCDIEIDGKLPRPCLEYHLKRCLAPCVKGLCTKEEYRKRRAMLNFCSTAKTRNSPANWNSECGHFAENQNYELAAKYRDLHKTVIALGEQQKMAMTADLDVDIFGFYREKQRLALQLFTMREGASSGGANFSGKIWTRKISMFPNFSAKFSRSIIRPIMFRSKFTFRMILQTATFWKKF